MSKIKLKPGTLMAPLPVVMVSCGRNGIGADSSEKANIITIAWTGIINSDPPMTYISVRKERHSHEIIRSTGEFVINLTTEDLSRATDWCGVRSGRDYDKFKEQKLTAVASEVVNCPQIAQSPLCLECRVRDVVELGSHDMFIAEIVSISADEKLIDEKGELHLEKAGLIAYNHGHYYTMKKQEIGRFGFSVMKAKTRKRIEAKKRAEFRQSRRAETTYKNRNAKRKKVD